jgi:peptidoglycan/xylan/chitin deacetylase (PgdA/CDA1 family)
VKPSPAPPSSAPPLPPVNLVEYDGIVEHLFFHEVIAYPRLAFNGGSMELGYDQNMVTVSEFNKMLDSMYNNGFILVDLNDVWSEYVNDDGLVRMKKNTLMIPEGKKPLVLSFDDISFYEYMRYDGFMQKLIIGEDGEIWASGFDPDGNAVVSQDFTVVTILDRFVREHPDFSLNGVKGCIALTGYEGILGYRTQTDKNDSSDEFRLNRMQEVARVRPVIQRLHETGWYFATHSYGHINLENASLDRVREDALRWLDEVGSLVGETQIFIYPFGTRLDGSDVNNTGPAFRMYHDLGFRIFASVGIESFSRIKTDISAVVCDRMHSDGISLRYDRQRYLMFYDAIEVFDPLRPDFGNSW